MTGMIQIIPTFYFVDKEERTGRRSSLLFNPIGPLIKIGRTGYLTNMKMI